MEVETVRLKWGIEAPYVTSNKDLGFTHKIENPYIASPLIFPFRLSKHILVTNGYFFFQQFGR